MRDTGDEVRENGHLFLHDQLCLLLSNVEHLFGQADALERGGRLGCDGGQQALVLARVWLLGEPGPENEQTDEAAVAASIGTRPLGLQRLEKRGSAVFAAAGGLDVPRPGILFKLSQDR